MPRKRLTPPEQAPLIAEQSSEANQTPEERFARDQYRHRLADSLQAPDFRSIEGFPIGDDEAILALSDPPYYTACPNPFLSEIIEKWQRERKTTRHGLGLDIATQARSVPELYHREPFAADVAEGKNDPIYNAHSYHTKVPHKAIMRYLLHYTEPGDVVLDGFCGTGMTGVAAQLCGQEEAIQSLGYSVRDGIVYDERNEAISRLGGRHSILTDLSPIATFIAYNYNARPNKGVFEQEAKRILKEVQQECGWMYETTHADGITKGRINFTVWSDVFLCPNCAVEMIFWDVAIDTVQGQVRDAWSCPQCGVLVSKNPPKNSGALKVEHAWENVIDKVVGRQLRRTKQAPVLINYSVGSKRFEKRPDQNDLRLIKRIEEQDVPYPFPEYPMMFKGSDWGDTWRAGIHAGITHVHHFFTHRNLWVLSKFWQETSNAEERRCRFWFTSSLSWCGRENRLHLGNYFGKSGGVITSLRGTWYIASLSVETNVIERFRLRLSSSQYRANVTSAASIISTNSSTEMPGINPGTVDYIFIDPPFGSNLMYSELNFVAEGWLHVHSNIGPEAVINASQKKRLYEYGNLMERCFRQFHTALKPGRWITVEFHNSQNAVWNAIQQAIMSAGFVVADVRTLDKGKGTFKQVTTSSAVKHDLIISAYKPATEFEKTFQSRSGTVQGAWDFTRQHVDHLPLPAVKNGVMEALQERMPYLVYDRMVAFHLQRGLTIPLSAAEFYQGLSQLFLEREGMIFTGAQAAEYDKLRLRAERVEQLALFVTDESSARQWLRQELDPSAGRGPQTYGDLQPHFVQKLRQSKYEQLPELKTLLEQSFVRDDSGKWHVPEPENRAHLEQLRQNALLREFQEYRNSRGSLRLFRSEAIRAGFSHAWREHDYDAIVEIAERMPEAVLQEDQQLLMYYHNASLRQSGQPKQENLL